MAPSRPRREQGGPLPPGGAALQRELHASRSLAAPPSGEGSQRKVHSSLSLLYRYLRVLYGSGRVPDAEAFNRFLMVYIAEVADNAHYRGNRPYQLLPEAAEAVRVRGATVPYDVQKVADPAGRKAPANNLQTLVNRSGLAAFTRCALQYVLGTKRHALPKAGEKRRERHVAGKALSYVYLDYALYDASRPLRGLPAASVAPFTVHLVTDPEKAFCGVLATQGAPGPLGLGGGGVTLPAKTLTKLFNKVKRYAKRVALDLAMSLPPHGKGVNRAASTSSSSPPPPPHDVATAYNSDLAGTQQGVMQHLMAARHHLAQLHHDFPHAASLASFLEASLERALSFVHKQCVRVAGEDRCHPLAANSTYPLPPVGPPSLAHEPHRALQLLHPRPMPEHKALPPEEAHHFLPRSLVHKPTPRSPRLPYGGARGSPPRGRPATPTAPGTPRGAVGAGGAGSRPRPGSSASSSSFSSTTSGDSTGFSDKNEGGPPSSFSDTDSDGSSSGLLDKASRRRGAESTSSSGGLSDAASSSSGTSGGEALAPDRLQRRGRSMAPAPAGRVLRAPAPATPPLLLRPGYSAHGDHHFSPPRAHDMLSFRRLAPSGLPTDFAPPPRQKVWL